MNSHDLPSVTETARRLGLRVGRTGSSWHASPCPACGSERRHNGRSDRRGAIGIRPDDQGFCCFSCGVTGTAFSLARYADNDNAAREVPAPEPTPPPTYPPATELGALMAACVPCEQDDEVAAWLRALRIDRTDCAMALAAFEGELPRWATYHGASWQRTGHRLVVPLYDATGTCRSVLARAVRPAEAKSVGVTGYQRRELVGANALGQAMLAGKRVSRCLVVEGEKKLALADHLSAGRWAVLATGSGMWSDAIGKACGRARRVDVFTDPDEAGCRYATAVYKSLAGRCVLRPEMRVAFGVVELASGARIADDDLWQRGGVPSYCR